MISPDQLLPLLQQSFGSATIVSCSSPLPPEFTGISTDSRQISPGSLFIALRGEKFDGHEFLAQTLAQGAIGAIVDQHYSCPSDLQDQLTLWQVPNTLQAYQTIAQDWRERFRIPLVGVTGSVGKTTTKELIAVMLGQRGTVLKTQANYNNEIGVPKTLLELNDRHDYAVIEMAMRGTGEIAELTRLAQPTIGVITNVGVAHIERLGSREAIAAAKCELLGEMAKASRPVTGQGIGQGTAILNADNPLLLQTADRCWSGRTLTFGLTAGDIRGRLWDLETLEVEGQRFHLPLAGEHNAVNFLAGLAVARELGVDWATLTHLQLTLPGGRSQRYWLPNDRLLLDETYNAGPESMIAALKLLAQTPGQRHLAVLGTMKELGDRSLGFHTEIGEWVKTLGLDGLYILADPPEAEALAQGAAPIPVQLFDDPSTLALALQQDLQPGDRVLFKASRS
ncbi:MAG: UDP-N-acetylmuramoyl-tripeptide--D-alanyl-D-alanine ligase, partial [Prochlorotrichaceae cyanobacterium]